MFKTTTKTTVTTGTATIITAGMHVPCVGCGGLGYVSEQEIVGDAEIRRYPAVCRDCNGTSEQVVR